jgi:sugar O-acyltransferase (sialic acid O-acetyltransferase NeuD family)
MGGSIYALYGASGFGREVLPIAREQLRLAGLNGRLVFVDDELSGSMINGHSVLSYDDFLLQPESLKSACVTIANSRVRQEVYQRLLRDGVQPLSVLAENSIRMDEVELDVGAVVCSNTMLTSNIKIGCNFHLNIYSYVAHDCVIGDYVTFAPRVSCNGNVHIADHAYIGTGAVIKQGTADKPLVIGRGAVVGMGAVVTKDVAPGAVVVGNPARLLSA